MATRFTDDLFRNTEGSDFVVRRRRPLVVQLLFIFAAAFFAIYFTGGIMHGIGSKVLFFFTLSGTIGALAWFTIFFAARHRDLMMATEFQNAMLASAAQLSTRFCLITKADGSIVYIDPGFQKTFPAFTQGDTRGLEGLMEQSEISKETLQSIFDVLAEGRSDRMLLPLKDETGAPMPMMMTIDNLPRPKGYFLFRGRDYIEKRATEVAAAPVVAEKRPTDIASALLLEQALFTLPEGVLVAGSDNVITYLNNTLAEWLGYSRQELLDAPFKSDRLFYQYAGHAVGAQLAQDFAGEATFQRKNRTLLTTRIRQTLLYDNGKLLGMSVIISPPST